MSDIHYSVYQDSDRDEVTALLAKEFSDRDPPAVATGISEAEFAEFVSLFCSRAADQQLTIVARSSATDALCGAVLTEDCALDMPPGIEGVSEKFGPIFEILGELDEEYRNSSQAPTGPAIHLLLLGVSRDFAGRGVAHGLVSECLANGANRGFQMAVTEATNPTSQHIFRKRGFSDRVTRSYADHQSGEQKPFASIADAGGPILMDKQLAVSE